MAAAWLKNRLTSNISGGFLKSLILKHANRVERLKMAFPWGHREITADIRSFYEICDAAEVRVPPDCPFKKHLDRALAALRAFDDFQGDEVVLRADAIGGEALQSVIAVARLSAAVSGLHEYSSQLQKRIWPILQFDTQQTAQESQSKTYLYELECGAWFRQAGFELQFSEPHLEPDIVLRGNGLTKPIGVSCKYPHSPKLDRINHNISKGYRQLRESGFEGFVSVGMDDICLRGVRSLRIPEDDSVVNADVDGYLARRSEEIASDRAMQPGRSPLGPVMFTMTATGVREPDHHVATLHRARIQIPPGSESAFDLKHIASVLSLVSNGAWLLPTASS